VRLFVTSLVFVAAGAVIVISDQRHAADAVASSGQPPWIGWFGIAFFGLGALIFGIQLIWPNSLTLDEHGYTLRIRADRRVFSRRWDECGPFTTAPAGSFGAPVRVVVYKAAHSASSQLGRLNLDLTSGHGNEALPASRFGGLNADDLAALLNRYRDAYSAAVL
jgi:hypothetical protein